MTLPIRAFYDIVIDEASKPTNIAITACTGLYVN